eukprot:GHVN01090089.1.p1 GENE.GHVN01090089.1~~GHVN01090089.1.p1  ORF type:complete len:1440 (-),score=348.61 GHVN01090089.1:19-4140(-)
MHPGTHPSMRAPPSLMPRGWASMDSQPPMVSVIGGRQTHPIPPLREKDSGHLPVYTDTSLDPSRPPPYSDEPVGLAVHNHQRFHRHQYRHEAHTQHSPRYPQPHSSHHQLTAAAVSGYTGTQVSHPQHQPAYATTSRPPHQYHGSHDAYQYPTMPCTHMMFNQPQPQPASPLSERRPRRRNTLQCLRKGEVRQGGDGDVFPWVRPTDGIGEQKDITESQSRRRASDSDTSDRFSETEALTDSGRSINTDYPHDDTHTSTHNGGSVPHSHQNWTSVSASQPTQNITQDKTKFLRDEDTHTWQAHSQPNHKTDSHPHPRHNLPGRSIERWSPQPPNLPPTPAPPHQMLESYPYLAKEGDSYSSKALPNTQRQAQHSLHHSETDHTLAPHFEAPPRSSALGLGEQYVMDPSYEPLRHLGASNGVPPDTEEEGGGNREDVFQLTKPTPYVSQMSWGDVEDEALRKEMQTVQRTRWEETRMRHGGPLGVEMRGIRCEVRDVRRQVTVDDRVQGEREPNGLMQRNFGVDEIVTQRRDVSEYRNDTVPMGQAMLTPIIEEDTAIDLPSGIDWAQAPTANFREQTESYVPVYNYMQSPPGYEQIDEHQERAMRRSHPQMRSPQNRTNCNDLPNHPHHQVDSLPPAERNLASNPVSRQVPISPIPANISFASWAVKAAFSLQRAAYDPSNYPQPFEGSSQLSEVVYRLSCAFDAESRRLGEWMEDLSKGNKEKQHDAAFMLKGVRGCWRLFLHQTCVWAWALDQRNKRSRYSRNEKQVTVPFDSTSKGVQRDGGTTVADGGGQRGSLLGSAGGNTKELSDGQASASSLQSQRELKQRRKKELERMEAERDAETQEIERLRAAVAEAKLLSLRYKPSMCNRPPSAKLVSINDGLVGWGEQADIDQCRDDSTSSPPTTAQARGDIGHEGAGQDDESEVVSGSDDRNEVQPDADIKTSTTNRDKGEENKGDVSYFNSRIGVEAENEGEVVYKEKDITSIGQSLTCDANQSAGETNKSPSTSAAEVVNIINLVRERGEAAVSQTAHSVEPEMDKVVTWLSLSQLYLIKQIARLQIVENDKENYLNQIVRKAFSTAGIPVQGVEVMGRRSLTSTPMPGCKGKEGHQFRLSSLRRGLPHSFHQCDQAIRHDGVMSVGGDRRGVEGIGRDMGPWIDLDNVASPHKALMLMQSSQAPTLFVDDDDSHLIDVNDIPTPCSMVSVRLSTARRILTDEDMTDMGVEDREQRETNRSASESEKNDGPGDLLEWKPRHSKRRGGGMSLQKEHITASFRLHKQRTPLSDRRSANTTVRRLTENEKGDEMNLATPSVARGGGDDVTSGVGTQRLSEAGFGAHRQRPSVMSDWSTPTPRPIRRAGLHQVNELSDEDII